MGKSLVSCFFLTHSGYVVAIQHASYIALAAVVMKRNNVREPYRSPTELQVNATSVVKCTTILLILIATTTLLVFLVLLSRS